MKKLLTLPAVTRIAPSSVAFLELPIGPSYENLHFTMTGTGLAATMVDTIKVTANGTVLQEYKNLQQLIDINAYHGRATDVAGDWCLYFDNDDYLSLAEKELESLGTLGLRTLTVEITLGATWPANGTIVVDAAIDTKQEPLGNYNKIKQMPYSSSVSGVVDIDRFERNGTLYKQIHFFKADVNNIYLEADGVKVFDVTKAQIERQQKNVRPFARVPQTAKATHLDFLLNGFYKSALDTQGMGDLRAKITLGTSGAIDIVTETLDFFKG